MVDWSYNSGRWHHLDDVMALTFTMFASALIVRKRSWWLVGLLLGTAVAAKPWAVILSPVLMGLPRSERSRAALMTIVVAAVWWSPFILGASGTIHSLGSFPVPIRPGSEWWLFGMRGDIHTWLRPVQFIGGVVLGVLVARRTDRAWLAAPLAALAFRVLTDPFMWSYYGMGPVLFAFLWDMTRPGKWTRLPIYSVVTLLVEGLLPWLPLVAGFGTLNDWFVTVEWAKLAWGIAILVALLVETSPARRASSFVPAETAVSAPAAG
jgi:hypothetical protein